MVFSPLFAQVNVSWSMVTTGVSQLSSVTTVTSAAVMVTLPLASNSTVMSCAVNVGAITSVTSISKGH